ncbi:MAG: 50S ribosomal protein L6 [Candidatus Levybacteria bacterium]|nr:50S ribosomal protein L6 [Candidatus Levybacteria bacterium]
MSKIGKMPVTIPEGVTVSVERNVVSTSGSKGNLTFTIPQSVEVKMAEGKVIVSQKEENEKSDKALFGLTRATIANMVKGVSQGFEKKLELSGVGYRAQVSGSDLVLSVGFSHPVKINKAEGLSFSVAENVITIAGSDKTLVGDMAARIRKIRPPEPYKGKGIRYVGERIRRKAGKAAKAVGTK